MLSKKSEQVWRSVLWTGLVILVAILLYASVGRANYLSWFLKTGTWPSEGSFEYGYAKNPILSFLHILPGMVFIVLGAIQFIRPIRDKYTGMHRLLGKIYLLLGVVVAVTAIAMGLLIRFGGWVESSAVLFYGILFLYALARAYLHIRKRETVLHREWMIRAYSIGLAVATIRPIVGLFFVFTDLPFSRFFGITFWIGFSLHALIAELWIRYTRNTESVSLQRV